jgi:hypothetical protein
MASNGFIGMGKDDYKKMKSEKRNKKKLKGKKK